LSRICLDQLRTRASRREDLVARHRPDDHRADEPSGDPEQEALLLDEVGRALLVVLGTLTPAERIAFVLHDMFAVPFDEIAPIVDRSTATTKKLASRARHRVRGVPLEAADELRRHRRVVEAFLVAVRAGDVDAVIAVLDPDVVRRADQAALPAGRQSEIRGARVVAEEIAVFGGRARFAELLLVDGDVGIVIAPHGSPDLVLAVTVTGERIAGYQLIADPSRLAALDLAVLDGR
jgi:RNA polymerase sigma-70 factor (ECF subfamily)